MRRCVRWHVAAFQGVHIVSFHVSPLGDSPRGWQVAAWVGRPARRLRASLCFAVATSQRGAAQSARTKQAVPQQGAAAFPV